MKKENKAELALFTVFLQATLVNITGKPIEVKGREKSTSIVY